VAVRGDRDDRHGEHTERRGRSAASRASSCPNFDASTARLVEAGTPTASRLLAGGWTDRDLGCGDVRRYVDAAGLLHFGGSVALTVETFTALAHKYTKQPDLFAVSIRAKNLVMRVRGFCCGWLTADIGGLIEGESGRIRAPIPAYLIEHAGSTLVFDAGLHPDVRDVHSARHRSLAPDFDCDLPKGTDLSERLEACDVDPASIELLALSHLHFDHTGGSGLVGNAELVIQRTEWLAAVADVDGQTYMPADLDIERSLHLLDGEWDVFGDGRVRLLPTAGHTAGHQSLLVRTDDGGELLLCGDACYLRRSLQTLALPPHAFDRDAQLEVFERLRRLESAGARLLFGHDPEQWPDGPDDDRLVELSGAVL
jgi:N-acyl homoserine lactone hydrolase